MFKFLYIATKVNWQKFIFFFDLYKFIYLCIYNLAIPLVLKQVHFRTQYNFSIALTISLLSNHLIEYNYSVYIHCDATLQRNNACNDAPPLNILSGGQILTPVIETKELIRKDWIRRERLFHAYNFIVTGTYKFFRCMQHAVRRAESQCT